MKTTPEMNNQDSPRPSTGDKTGEDRPPIKFHITDIILIVTIILIVVPFFAGKFKDSPANNIVTESMPEFSLTSPEILKLYDERGSLGSYSQREFKFRASITGFFFAEVANEVEELDNDISLYLYDGHNVLIASTQGRMLTKRIYPDSYYNNYIIMIRNNVNYEKRYHLRANITKR
ncbi:hypothetical protein TI04_09785 [Achromatium sp. WMS2]|nr:hypothetical protein TI04_09785 [Achromatium sp. WMS2]